MHHRIRHPLLLIMCCCFSVALARADSNPAIDAIFADFPHYPDSPGCALGVIQDGEFIYRRGYGMANLEYGIPIDSATVFRTGSVGKQFTAATIALLAESGAIKLDDPLSRYFPEFPSWANDITIAQLVYHTSGIRDYLQLALLAGKGDDADYYTDDWVLQMLARQQETNFPPGSQHLYSNSGYLLQAHLVKRVSGQSLREYAQQNLFGPLDMQISHFHDDHTQIVPRRATGYAPDDDQASGFRISMTTLDMVGDGGVFTTIDELLNWDRNFYENRLGKGGPELIELLTTPGKLDDGTELDCAFGLGVESYRGQKLISHGGAFVGFRAEMMRFPELGFGVSVLCNRADAAPSELARRVADVLLAGQLAPKTDSAKLPDFAMSVEELQKFTGDFWEHDEAFAAESRVIDGQLWAVHSPDRKNVLRPISPNRFQMMGVPAEVLVDFEMEDSQVKAFRRFINGEARGVFVPFNRLQLTPAELAGYAGEYYSPELEISYALTVSEDKLWFSLDDEGLQELTAMFGETFENPDYGAFTFSKNSAGKVDGFKLQSGRVRNLEFVRRP